MSDNKASRERWGYATSPDAEEWRGACLSREDAIEEGRAELADQIEPGEPIYIQRGKAPEPSTFVPDAGWVIEHMSERAGDNGAPECAEGWPDVSEEGVRALDSFLRSWAEKHAPIGWWIGEGTPERIDPERGAP